MKKNQSAFLKIILLLAVCFLFVFCNTAVSTDGNTIDNDDSDTNDDDDTDDNSGDDTDDDTDENFTIPARPPTFSHKSGLYQNSFDLTLTTREGLVIYYSIDGSIPDPSKIDGMRVFEYNSPIQVIDRNNPVQPNLLATPENSEKFYGHTWDPRGSMPTPYYPTDAQVPKATVIRALTVNSLGNKSDVVTSTYFIGNNLANYANHPVMSLVTDPANLIDEATGIYVRGHDENRWDGPNIYNFRQRGDEWERTAVLELFEGNAVNRSIPFSTTVGIRIRGGWSRDKGQKSFNVYFRQEYGGINNLRDYNLIPGAVQSNGQPVAIYKSFMLRNGGNDTEETKLFDVFIHNLLKDRSFTTQASVPCIVYINGEYWGFYNLQERYSDNHTEYKYGVNRNNVISFDNGALDDGNPGEESLYWSIMNFRNVTMNDLNYAEFCKVVDINNFIDYWAAQCYINNQDWPHNNYRLWRTRNTELGNPYGDTKWRWQLFDAEFSMGLYSGGGVDRDPFAVILNGDNQWHHNNQLFKNLTTNDSFCRQFVNTIMDLYNVNFHPDIYSIELDRLAGMYKPLMIDYVARFFYYSMFDGRVNNIRNYMNNIRSKMVNEYLPNNFSNLGISSGNLSNITLITRKNGANLPGASIKINTVTIDLTGGSRTVQYYSAIPITVTANIPAGYEFTGWTVTGGAAVSPSGLTTVINFTGDVVITANYK
ncbi:MAG: CotH kinase family protein [Treponema sp.]|nr:CotH kinase family protein [Treponema sp.]